MSLPPGFLDELRSRSSLAQVAGRKVTWDMRKSNQGKGDWWAPCPFHQEKTASFHVDDRKGFYYCFGCHAKGDALNFVQETENVGFMEAVEILAREAGMPMPAPDPKARERADRNAQLVEVMEAAVSHYRLQLKTAAAAHVREYLAGRGLKTTAVERWQIGFAPDARRGLTEHLLAKGFDEARIVEAGLAAKPDDGGPAYDRFRGRIIFPIRDARDRAIALGGRATDPNARAKYLNSPETPLFDKGRVLFNHGPAREAAGKGQPLIVAEGYMDVIALAEAGFGAAVAPLGTAITEDQLRLLWRIAPEPVIALDGDTAGLRAGMRVIDLALPMLEAGNALRFALLPEGLDPDDLIRQGGREAMARAIEAAVPMVDLLWRRETEGKVFDSPERRAALDAGLRTSIARIADRSIRDHYTAAIRDLRADLFRPARGNPPGRRDARRPGDRQPRAASAELRSSALGRDGNAASDHLREAVILAICITHPGLIERFEPELARLEPVDAMHRDILRALMDHAHRDTPPEGADAMADAIGQDIGRGGVQTLLAHRHIAIAPAVRDREDTAKAEAALREELSRLAASRGARTELADAMADFDEAEDEALTWRLSRATEARARAERARASDESEGGEDREGMSAFLQNLIDDEVWVKKKR